MLSETIYWIWLSLSCEPKAAWAAYRQFGSAERVWQAGPEDLAQVPGLKADHIRRLSSKSTDRAERILRRCEQLGAYLFTWDDEGYPDRLRSLHLPPMVLYCLGRPLNFNQECAVAMAGSRRCSPYGRSMAERFAADLTRQGALVVTGMAGGCDEAALIAALRAGGPVAVLLPGGVDVPFENSAYYRHLYRSAAQLGTLVSPYPPGTPNDHRHFFYRNPILTGLSVATLCVEAGVHSGVLNVASHAADQGRTLYVIPANLDSETAAGTNALLCSGVALPVMSAGDILLPFCDTFPRLRPDPGRRRRAGKKALKMTPQNQDAAAPQPSESEKRVDTGGDSDYIDLRNSETDLTQSEIALLLALQAGERTAEELSAETGIPTAQLLSSLTMLTLRSYVEEQEGGRFAAAVRVKN